MISGPRCITGESASVAKNWTTCSRAPPGLSLSFVPAATLLNGCSPQMPHLLFFSGEQLMRREFSAAGQCPSIARVVEHCESSGRVSVVVLTLSRHLLQPVDHNPQCGVHTPQSREMEREKYTFPAPRPHLETSSNSNGRPSSFFPNQKVV